MKYLTLTITLLLLSSVVHAAPSHETAPAQPKTPGQKIVKSFGDWSKICVEQEKGGKLCQIVQSANQNSTGKLVFQTAVGYVPDNDKPIMYLTGPLGIFLPKGISVFVDDNPGLTATVQRCDGSGCLALLALNEDMLKQLQSGKKGKLVFAANAKQNVSLPLSLGGFKDAFNSLEKPVPSKSAKAEPSGK